MRRLNVAILLLAALTLGCLAFGSRPAAAEDNLGTVNQITEWGPFRYEVYQYPSRVSSFFFYPKSYVTFDVHNGKYWMIESPRFNLTMVRADEMKNLLGFYEPYQKLENFTLSFYTPDMKLLGRVVNPQTNRTFSIPRDGNNYEHLVVRLESNANTNWDVKFVVWEPVDPVIAEPMTSPSNRER